MLAINGICKNWARVIMCYGLSEDQLNVINDNLPTSGCEVMSVDCFTDIIAMPQMVAIVVWDIMSEIDRGSFEEFFTDIAPFLETVIVIGKPDDLPIIESHSQYGQMAVSLPSFSSTVSLISFGENILIQ